MIKTLKKVGNRRNLLNITKAVSDKPTANILSGEKLNTFPLRSGQNKSDHSHHFYST